MLGVLNMISFLKGSKAKSLEITDSNGVDEFMMHVNTDGYHLGIDNKGQAIYKEFKDLTSLREYLRSEFNFEENETRALLSVTSWDI